jgi:uncharacterized Rmd1/YagE family protein
MQESLTPFDGSEQVFARAWYIAQRIDVRALDRGEMLSRSPLTMRAGARGVAMVFRCGAVAFFEMDQVEEASFVESIAPFLKERVADPEIDELSVIVAPDDDERIDSEAVLRLHEATLERLQIVAHILVKSTVLAHYESRVARVVDGIEPIAERLRGGRGTGIRGRALLRQIGDVLLIQTRTVGRLEISEKPELTWDRADLDRLYGRLAIEYELADRDRALTRKLGLISHTAETLLDVLQNRRTLHVEWYIVLLIAVEIGLMLYEMGAR